MSGRRDASPTPGDAASTPAVEDTPSAVASSQDSVALTTILNKLSGLDDSMSSFRRSMQRMDGRLDSVVGGLTSLRERVQEMEDWIPGEDPDAPSEVADREHQPTTTAPSTTIPTDTTATHSMPPATTQAALSNTPVVSSTPVVTTNAPQPPARPPRASGRPPHMPHALKPPQVRAFRGLTITDKDELRRLAGLLGGLVRSYLDGDINVAELEDAEATGRDDQDSRHSSNSVAASATGDNEDNHHSHHTHTTRHTTAHAQTALNTPPASPVQLQTLTCKQEFLGSFDGKPFELENFVSRILNLRRSDRRQAWENAIVRALPMALKGDAAAWHEGLSDEEAEELDSVHKWVDAMRTAFPVNSLQQRRNAQQRAWRFATETVSEYYHQKLRLLRQAYGRDQSEERLVSEIKDTLPASMRAMIRVPIKGATLLDLRTELIEAEPQWKEMYGNTSAPAHVATSPTTPTTTKANFAKQTATSKVNASAMARSASAPALPAADPASPAPTTGGFGLAATYDPSRVTPAANGKPRSYRRPDGVTMELNRPCTRCGADYFNFEHFHLAAPQVRMLEVLPGDDEYPESRDEVTEDVGESSDFI